MDIEDTIQAIGTIALIWVTAEPVHHLCTLLVHWINSL